MDYDIFEEQTNNKKVKLQYNLQKRVGKAGHQISPNTMKGEKNLPYFTLTEEV